MQRDLFKFLSEVNNKRACWHILYRNVDIGNELSIRHFGTFCADNYSYFYFFFFFKSLQGKAFSIFSIQKSQCCPNLAQSHHAVKNYIRYVTRESRCGRIRGMHTTNWKYSQGNWENIFLGIVLKRWAKFYEL